MGSSHVVFLNIFFYGDVTQKRHWQKNLPVGFNGLSEKTDNTIIFQKKNSLNTIFLDFNQ